MIPDNMHLLPKDQPHRSGTDRSGQGTSLSDTSAWEQISAAFSGSGTGGGTGSTKGKGVWIANRRKHPSWNLLRMNCHRRQRIKSSPMQDGRRNGLHKKQSRRKIVCRPGRNCAWRRISDPETGKPKTLKFERRLNPKGPCKRTCTPASGQGGRQYCHWLRS